MSTLEKGLPFREVCVTGSDRVECTVDQTALFRRRIGVIHFPASRFFL
jgi:hypothetical protein